MVLSSTSPIRSSTNEYPACRTDSPLSPRPLLLRSLRHSFRGGAQPAVIAPVSVGAIGLRSISASGALRATTARESPNGNACSLSHTASQCVTAYARFSSCTGRRRKSSALSSENPARARIRFTGRIRQARGKAVAKAYDIRVGWKPASRSFSISSGLRYRRSW